MKTRILSLVACAFALPIAAHATITPSYERGDALVWLEVPNNKPEVCVIPKHLPTGKYGKKDRQHEENLCAMDVGVSVAACAKDNSTNPGVDFFEAPEGVSLAQLTKMDCNHKDAMKEAKYKLSTSCSYTPAILGYYHMSRALGDIGNVPPAVLRTMNLERHLAIGGRALSTIKSDQLIYKTWSGLISSLRAGKNAKNADLLFTDDYDQSYGALSKNPKKEEFYKEFFNGGTDRVATFKASNKIYAALSNPRLSVGRDWNGNNVQAMVQLRDMADMILMDTILGQQDRFGNIHYIEKYYYTGQKDGRFDVGSDKDKKDVPAEALAGAVKVKEMVLKDNDCGVAKENRIKNGGLLDRVSHLNPRTYKHLLALTRTIDEPDTKRLFTRGMVFTEADFAKVSGNLKEAAGQLQSACRAGRLKLDLDLDAHFSGEALAAADCE